MDETTVVVKIGRKEGGGMSGRTVTQTARLDLAKMKGAAATIIRELAEICAQPEKAQRINVSYSIGDTYISITFDPSDLPNHPQRRRPVTAKIGRALGIDLNPNWIGLAVASNVNEAARIEDTELLEQALVKLDMEAARRPSWCARRWRWSVASPSRWLGNIVVARSFWKKVLASSDRVARAVP